MNSLIGWQDKPDHERSTLNYRRFICLSALWKFLSDISATKLNRCLGQNMSTPQLKAPATGLEQYTNRAGSNPWCKYNDGSKVSLVLEDSKTISFKKLLFSMDLKLFSQLISMSDLVKDSRLKWALATSCTWVRQEPVHKQQVRHQLTRTYSTDIRMEIRLAICGTLVTKTIWGEEWQDRIHTDI